MIADIPKAVSSLAEILSITSFSLLWGDEPDFVHTVVTRAEERLLMFVEKAGRLGVDAFRITGAEYITQQFSPAAYDSLCRDQDRELVESIHRHNAIAYYHAHGDVGAYLETFASLGIHALDPLEVAPYGDVDLADAKARIGSSVCLVSGLDDLDVLSGTDVEAIRAMARKCLDTCGPTGYCLGGTASSAYGPEAARNFMALVETAEQYGAA